MGKCILAGHPPVGGQIGYGTYTGDGAASRTISLGITPKWVLVIPQDGRIAQWEGYAHMGGLAVTGNAANRVAGQPIVQITSGGFQVYTSSYIMSNSSQTVYNYIYGT